MKITAPVKTVEAAGNRPAAADYSFPRVARWTGAAPTSRPTLSASEVQAYRDKGFAVVRNALTPGEVDGLNLETVRICRGELGAVNRLTPAEAAESDDEVLRRHVCIHFPHKISGVMHRHLAHPVVVDVLSKIVSPNLKALQSMLFIKAAGKPGQAWHQDEYYIPTRDRSLTGVWIAMDDATVENGCLWVLPGSHKAGIIWPQRVHEDRRFDCNGEAVEFPYKDEDAIPLEIPRGSIAFFNGYLLHRSLPNVAKAGFRRALANHYASGETLVPWFFPPEGKLMGNHDYRDIVMVAGRDPYAFKGFEDISIPHVRRSGEGGCGDPKLNASKGSA